jgi:hypothetical protein
MEFPPEMDLTLTVKSCANVTLGIINFAGAFEGITLIFSCLLRVPEWTLC